jgi:heme A synthase
MVLNASPERSSAAPGSRRFAVYAWGVLAFNLLVIIWGAYVRATGSGAGCGSHWPLCNGAVLPDTSYQATFIEFAHRISSGVALLLVAALLLWSRRIYPSGSVLRLTGWLALFFIIIEALLGAGLVVFELVADNDSVARAFWMALHLINTFLLLIPLTLTAWWAGRGEPVRTPRNGLLIVGLGIGLLGTLLLGVSGAVAALGDTLFPVSSLREGIAQDMSPTAHILVRLRIFHPPLAALMGVYLIVTAWLVQRHVATLVAYRLALLLTLLFAVEVVVGMVNVLLLAPVGMQLVHLLLATLLWVCLVLLATEALTSPATGEKRVFLSDGGPLWVRQGYHKT